MQDTVFPSGLGSWLGLQEQRWHVGGREGDGFKLIILKEEKIAWASCGTEYLRAGSGRPLSGVGVDVVASRAEAKCLAGRQCRDLR